MDKLNIALAFISLVVLAWLFSSVDSSRVAKALSQADLRLVAAGLLLGFVGLSLRTVRWGLLIREKHAVPWSDLYAIQCSGMAVSHFSPGKVLEAVKMLPLKKQGVSYSFSVISIIWERVMDLLVIFAFAFLAFPAFDSNLRAALLAIFVAVVLVAIASFRHLEHFLSLFAKLPFLGFLSKVESHSFKKRTLALAFVTTFVAWLFDAAAAWLAFQALGMNIEFLSLTSAFFASIIAGIISFLPGGLGSTEALMTFLLKGTGYPAALLLGGVLLARAFTLGVSTVVGFGLLPTVKK